MPFFLRILIVFSSISLFTASTFAGDWGVDAEPYAGFGFMINQSGTIGYSASIPGSWTSSGGTGGLGGFGLGAKAVVKYSDLVYLGPDFSWYPGADWVNNIKFGGVVGVQLPMGFRMWGGYNFIDTYNFTSNPGGGSVKGSWGGSSFKIGAGWSPMSFLSVNAEYLFGTISSTSSFTASYNGQPATAIGTVNPTGTINPTTGTLNPALTNNILLLTVSAPIALSI